MNAPALSLAPEMAGRVRLGALVIEGVRVASADPALMEEITKLGESLRSRFAGQPSGDVPGVEAARSLYKALGLDPTKTRPSNEALLRRVLKGEPLYRINTLVDALNGSSLKQQFPYGLYDLDRLRPPILLRFGAKDESYEGIRKGSVSVAGRPVLVDQEGPFGNPSSDSGRSQITLETVNALVVLYAPASATGGMVEASLRETAGTLTRFCGGRMGESLVLPS
jgi:DNA/RNA-binding domain of Phe-tRNA-synthetase-like protein